MHLCKISNFMKLKYIVLIYLLVLVACRSNTTTQSKANDLHLKVSFESYGGKVIESWSYFAGTALYYDKCNLTHFEKIKARNDSSLLAIIDRLDSNYLLDYGCENRSSIGGDNLVRFFITKKSLTEDKHLNFSISACFLDTAVSELISELNKILEPTKIKQIPNFQRPATDCQCKPYEFRRIYKQ